MKNKKGFTLIELLAVIVILAIIALIVVPIVLNMINSARKSAAKSSSLGFIDSIEYYSGFAQANGDGMNLGDYDSSLLPIEDTVCTKENGVWTTCTELMNKIEKKSKGKAPTDAQITLDKNGKILNGWVKYNEYYCTYNGSDIKDECTKAQPDSTSSSNEPEEPSVPTVQYVYGLEKLVYASDGSTDRPTSKLTYLKYELTDGEIASGTKPEVCIYTNSYNGELCLVFNNVSESLNRMKQYFGWDESTGSTSGNINCSFGNNSSCTNSSFRVIAEGSGNIYIYDDIGHLRCSVTNSYNDRCENT